MVDLEVNGMYNDASGSKVRIVGTLAENDAWFRLGYRFMAANPDNKGRFSVIFYTSTGRFNIEQETDYDLVEVVPQTYLINEGYTSHLVVEADNPIDAIAKFKSFWKNQDDIKTVHQLVDVTPAEPREGEH